MGSLPHSRLGRTPPQRLCELNSGWLLSHGRIRCVSRCGSVCTPARRKKRGGDYFGEAVSRAARIGDVGCGGQIIVSAATAALIAGEAWARTSDLGEHRLRGLERPERLFRLDADGLDVVDVPLLRGLEAAGNLPHQRAQLVGRDQSCGILIGCWSLGRW